MDVGCGKKYMNARAYCRMQRLCRALNIVLRGASQRSNNWRRHRGSYRLNRGKITVRGDWESRLDHIYPKAVELTRQAGLFLHIHAAARRLLAIAQSRVENRNSIALHHKLPSIII